MTVLGRPIDLQQQQEDPQMKDETTACPRQLPKDIGANAWTGARPDKQQQLLG
jgi:hypothetical protein